MRYINMHFENHLFGITQMTHNLNLKTKIQKIYFRSPI